MRRAADKGWLIGLGILVLAIVAYMLWGLWAIVEIVVFNDAQSPMPGALFMVTGVLGGLLMMLSIGVGKIADRKGDPYDRTRKARSQL